MDNIVDALNDLLNQDPALARAMLFPVAVTLNKDLAENSIFEFGSPDNGRTFWLSPLGLLNGAMPEESKVAAMYEDDGELVGFCIVNPYKEHGND